MRPLLAGVLTEVAAVLHTESVQCLRGNVMVAGAVGLQAGPKFLRVQIEVVFDVRWFTSQVWC